MSQYKGKTIYCAGQSYHDRSGFHPCANRGKHKEDGKLWCGTHLPSRVEAKRKARHDKWDAEYKATQARWKRANRIAIAEQKLVEACLEWNEETVLIPDRIAGPIDAVKKARAS